MAAVNRTRLTGPSFFIMARRGFRTSVRHRRLRRAAVLMAAMGVVAVAVLALRRGAGLIRERSETRRDVVSIMDVWNQGRYAEVAAIAEDRLAEEPLDRDALLFAGYARFFLAVSRLSAQDRNSDLDAAIGHLRLLAARGDTPHPERVDYILGKAYFLKGPYWADLSSRYLQAALDAGYQADDLYEFMGQAQSALGNLDAAMEWYELAAENHPTDRLLLTLGSEAFQLGRYDDAVRYYRRAIEGTRDDSIRKRGLSQLGQLYYDVGNYTMAREVLESLVEMDRNDENTMFLLAETYHELGLDDEARTTWFAVTRINPRHVGALRRLYD